MLPDPLIQEGQIARQDRVRELHLTFASHCRKAVGRIVYAGVWQARMMAVRTRGER
jgi:hypothetical protein